MMKLALALALATAAAPTLALAQDSYDEYCDPSGGCAYRNYDQDYGASPYGRDYGRYDYQYDRDDRGYDRDSGGAYDQGYGRRGADDRGYGYTGRVGSHWIDAAGRRCAWREVSWRDDDGYQATKWVAECR